MTNRGEKEMSDIVIPNAKLPTNCFTCDYEKLTENCPCYIGICSASEYKDSIHPDCPLKEVSTRVDWHTGTPTEDGDYVVFCQYRKDDGKLRKYKTVFEFKNGEWTKLLALEGNLDEFRIIAWYGQKIEPYKETD